MTRKVEGSGKWGVVRGDWGLVGELWEDYFLLLAEAKLPSQFPSFQEVGLRLDDCKDFIEFRGSLRKWGKAPCASQGRNA